MANIDISKLPPALQQALFKASQQSGQQPTSGGIPMDQAQAAPPELQPQPGDKMHPAEAMQLIQQHFAGQLTRGEDGRLTAQMPSTNPLLKLFGVKNKVAIDSPNYYSTAKEAGLESFLPQELYKTPEGTPFVGAKTLDKAREAAISSKKTDPMEDVSGLREMGRAFFQQAGSPEQVKAWDKMTDKQVNEFAKSIPGFRTQRSEYLTPKGTNDAGDVVEFDATRGKWFVGGVETPANQIGRLNPLNRPQLANEQVNEITGLFNAQQQLEKVKSLFDPSATGPIQSRLAQVSKLTGVDLGDLRGMSAISDNKTRLRTVMGSAINDYIKAITGAQMSEPEARRIMSVMPDAKAADEAFMPALQEIMQITDQKLNTRLDVLETQDPVGMKQLRALAKSRAAESRAPRTTSTKPAPVKKSLSDIFGKP